MRSVLAALALVVGTSAASAETWLVREGICGEFQSRWNVEQDKAGIWAGSADHVHVGGPCAQRTGETSKSRLRAAIVGESFFAALMPEPGAGDLSNACTYYGRIKEDRVSGIELCKGAAPMIFALRFPPKRDEQRPLEQQDDDWLGNLGAGSQ
jgi:hypothetical protein